MEKTYDPTLDHTIKSNILKAYQFRHACKEFDPQKKISDADFEFIMETGRLSPSSFGFEPWKFIVVQNDALRSKLLPVTWGAKKQLPTSSHFVLVLTRTKADMAADSQYVTNHLQQVKKLPEDIQESFRGIYHNFLANEFKLLDNDRAMFEWASRQSYIALGNMMTAAAQIGIDSCPIEGFDKAKVEQILKEENILGSFEISCMVAFGYRVAEPREKTRQTIQQVVEWIR